MSERLQEAAAAVSIRPADPAEMEAISVLVLQVFEAFVAPRYGAKGRDAFTRQATAEAIDRRLAAGSRGFVALEADATGAERRPIGYLEVQDSHVRLLFVAGPHQRKGIGRGLLGQVLALRPGAEITVNAAPGSEAAYARLGFVPAGPWLRVDGITFRPMARRA